MDEQTIAHMKSRIERCRRLASNMGDEHTAKVLNEMADEGQADLDRLLAENAAPANELPKSDQANTR